jgi:hypothetical protein
MALVLYSEIVAWSMSILLLVYQRKFTLICFLRTQSLRTLCPQNQKSPATSVRPLSTNANLPSELRADSDTYRASKKLFRVAECLRGSARRRTIPDYRTECL